MYGINRRKTQREYSLSLCVGDEIKEKLTIIASQMKKPPVAEELPCLKQKEVVKKPTPMESFNGVRLRAILQSKSENARERLEHDSIEVKALLSFLHLDCPIIELEQRGTFDKERTRTIVIKLVTERQKRLFLFSARKLASYKYKV